MRVIRQHIAKIEGRDKHTVTTRDIHDRVRYFGMSHSDVVDAVAVCVGMEPSADRRRKVGKLPNRRSTDLDVSQSNWWDAAETEAWRRAFAEAPIPA